MHWFRECKAKTMQQTEYINLGLVFDAVYIYAYILSLVSLISMLIIVNCDRMLSRKIPIKVHIHDKDNKKQWRLQSLCYIFS